MLSHCWWLLSVCTTPALPGSLCVYLTFRFHMAFEINKENEPDVNLVKDLSPVEAQIQPDKC